MKLPIGLEKHIDISKYVLGEIMQHITQDLMRAIRFRRELLISYQSCYLLTTGA